MRQVPAVNFVNFSFEVLFIVMNEGLSEYVSVYIWSDAVKYLSEILSTLNEREQEDWLERIIEMVRKQPCKFHEKNCKNKKLLN